MARFQLAHWFWSLRIGYKEASRLIPFLNSTTRSGCLGAGLDKGLPIRVVVGCGAIELFACNGVPLLNGKDAMIGLHKVAVIGDEGLDHTYIIGLE